MASGKSAFRNFVRVENPQQNVAASSETSGKGYYYDSHRVKGVFHILDNFNMAFSGEKQKGLSRKNGVVEVTEHEVHIPTVVLKSNGYDKGYSIAVFDKFISKSTQTVLGLRRPPMEIFPSNDLLRKYQSGKKEVFTDDHFLLTYEDGTADLVFPSGSIRAVHFCQSQGCTNYSSTPLCEECYNKKNVTKCGSCGKMCDREFCRKCWQVNCMICHKQKPTSDSFYERYCIDCERNHMVTSCEGCDKPCTEDTQYGGVCQNCYRKKGYSLCKKCRYPIKGKCPFCDDEKKTFPILNEPESASRSEKGSTEKNVTEKKIPPPERKKSPSVWDKKPNLISSTNALKISSDAPTEVKDKKDSSEAEKKE